jgi:GNAT superfamily N-acetyltransferase
MDYTIRLAKKKDAPSFYGISLRSHTASYYDQLIPNDSKSDFYSYYTWSEEAEAAFTAGINRKINHPDWFVAVAEQGGLVIGYTIAHLKDDGRLMLRGLFVDPDRQAKGAGTALFKKSLAWGVVGNPIELSVMENNTVARRIYEKCGFTVGDPKKKDFFGAKMIVMHRLAD